LKQIASSSAGTYRIGVGDDQAEWREWQGAAFDLTAKVLCSSCNGRLGGLESEVSPLIRAMVGGQPMRLYSQEQALLAQWLWKTALMVATANRDEASTLPKGHYAGLRSSFDLPPASTVWVGRVINPLHEAAVWVQRFLWRDGRLDDPPPAEGYSVVLTIKDLVGFVAIFDTRQSPESDPSVPPVFLGELGVGRLLRIWPRSQHYGVVWPPASTFTAAETRQLAKTIERAAQLRDPTAGRA
jgi:hypothetical protein